MQKQGFLFTRTCIYWTFRSANETFTTMCCSYYNLNEVRSGQELLRGIFQTKHTKISEIPNILILLVRQLDGI